MKIFVSIISVFILLLSCKKNSGEMYLSAEIQGLRKGTLLLQKIEDSKLITLDSLPVSGKAVFQFHSEIPSPEVYYLTMRFADSLQTEKSIPFFAEAAELKLVSKLDNYEFESSVTGSVNHQKWDEYRKLMSRYVDKNLELIEKQLQALKEGKDSLAVALGNQQQKLIRTRYLATINFAKNHSDFELAPYLMLSEVYDANIKYHDTIYKLLSPKIKDSKYGKALESFIQDRKKE